jgi:DNA invertase Pin-like site-specific DNA recombinase
MNIDYARVSTREQNLNGQVAELTAAGCAEVFREKASNRPSIMRGSQPGSKT